LLGKEMSAGHIKKPIRLLLNVLRYLYLFHLASFGRVF